ncbi:MAG: NAD-dependent epimerase/dehydratase family protein, partial [Chloroflexi bacterium]
MNIAVFGATGGTGREVVRQALGAGHSVTVVARNPSAMTFQHHRLRVLRGDVLVPGTFLQALAEQEAVVFSVGAADRSPTRIYSAGVMNVLMA